MMRSMYSGVAGLKTHQTRMDVIGNNIANVNTVGYKSQSVQFSELLYQTTSTASGPNANTGTGGVNAKQVGLGVKTGSISTAITTAGSAETTNRPFDICITGDSFFIVNNGKDMLFTRDGSFNVDAAGNLVMSSTGYNVMGWQVDPQTQGIKQDTVSALQIMSAANRTYPPEATTNAYIAGIVDKNSKDINSDAGKIVNLNFYDNLGYSYTAKLSVKATGTDGAYTVELAALLDKEGNDVTEQYNASIGADDYQTFPDQRAFGVTTGYSLARNSDNNYTLTRTADGTTVAITDGSPTADDERAMVAEAFGFDSWEDFSKLRYTAEDATQYTAEANLGSWLGLNYDPVADKQVDAISASERMITSSSVYYSTVDGSFLGVGSAAGGKSMSLHLTGDNFPDLIDVDFSTTTNVNNDGTCTISATTGDLDGIGAGRKLGEMTGVSIQNNGMIYATYDNGQTKLLGQIAAAAFANASGLSKEGDNLYAATQNSGQFDGIGVDITADGGYFTSGELEMSNVDLSSELTTMITTQRGFQANSRIITVSDSMLEELVNLKRG